MASSLENLGSIESWAFRPTFTDSWLCEAFSRDTEALTKALQDSISNTDRLSSFSPLFSLVNSDPLPTPTGSNISGSDHETMLKRQRKLDLPPTGKVSKSKRKSRSSKRSQTTFIKADPTNFRQMVQQVTGVRFGNAQMSPGPILKPEPQRPGSLPTLDTSAFLLDHRQPSPVVANAGASSDCDSLLCFPTLESWKA
ncbi:calmodulin-binding protein 25-like isoform X2 [Hibiscus syriacus]|uniref:calmodulin-binding protein 25-like isoform X2 n=1 Tax=Hibiscus syriacus TaxID=106335 RepID=UPI0019216D92|nr:calmodulin-binding protein 25-like isoform X2 [Hibiscus syriacus]